jgi:putative DNA primase/helicase
MPRTKVDACLSRQKNNLAPLGKGLAFRLTQHIVSDGAAVASCVVWESEHIEITADQALRAADERGAGGQRPGDEAADFLRSALGSGPMPVSQLKDDAAGIGLAWRTIRRAKERLGVRATKTGMDAGWVWELSKVATAPEDGHRSKEDTFAADGHLRTTNDEWPDLPACLDRRSLHKPRNAR